MPSALAWYVLTIVLMFILIFFVAVYEQSRSSGDLDTRWNTPVGWLLAAAMVGIVAVGTIAVYGTAVPVPDRGESGRFLLHTGPLIGGCVLIAVAVSHGQLVWLFRRAESRPTATVPDTDGTVIVTGEVEPAADESMPATDTTSPALDQPAVCWTWEFSIRGVLGQPDDRWYTRKADSGGVPFDLDDGSGSVRVDPTSAIIKLPMSDHHLCPADGPHPGRVGRNLHQSVGGEEYRYEEGVADDGDPLTVLGTVTDEGTLDARRIYRPGMATTATRRYTRRAVFAAGGGLVAIGYGVRLAASYFGTPLPF